MRVVDEDILQCAKLICFECEEEALLLVEIGEEMCRESLTTQICLDCLKKAVALAEKEVESRKE